MENSIILSITETDSLIDAVNWANRKVGKNNYRLECRWPSLDYIFRFQSNKDAMLFALKWAGS